MIELLRPRLQSVVNHFRSIRPMERLALGLWAVVGILFWIGLYVVSHKVLAGFASVELFGDLLLRKLLEIMLLSSLVLLVLSNVITALSAHYLSNDLQLLRTLPIAPAKLYYSKCAESLAASSWMVLLFALPVLLAMGSVLGAGWDYGLIALVVLACLLLPPAALGTVIATLLLRVFPARRTREFMVAVGVVMVGLLFLMLRWLQPERLLAAGSFDSVVPFFAYLNTAPVPWMPSTWARDVLVWQLGLSQDTAWISAGLLLSCGPASLALSRWMVQPMAHRGFTRAQEAGSPRLGNVDWFQGLLRWVTRPLSNVDAAVVQKDVRVLVRDAGQWSQIFLLFSLIIIYLYNIRVLPLDTVPFPSRALENLVSFLNIGLVGFVLAALAVRFAYPSISMEGRAFWMLRCAPLSMRRFALGKLFFVGVPMLLLGELLVVTSNTLLGASHAFQGLGIGAVLVLGPGIAALALGMGARSPDFQSDNAARLAASPGAILYMVLASLYVGGVLVLCALPVFVWMRADLRQVPVNSGELAIIVGSLLGAVALGVGVPLWTFLTGADQLGRMEGA